MLHETFGDKFEKPRKFLRIKWQREALMHSVHIAQQDLALAVGKLSMKLAVLSQAPRYFSRKATLVANADASASSSPRIIRPNGGDPLRSPAALDGPAPNGRPTAGA